MTEATAPASAGPVTTTPQPTMLVEALHHIARTAERSRTSTRRLRWIQQRAEWALQGRPYVQSEFELPRDAGPETVQRLKVLVRDLRDELATAQRTLSIDKALDALRTLRDAQPMGSRPRQVFNEACDILDVAVSKIRAASELLIPAEQSHLERTLSLPAAVTLHGVNCKKAAHDSGGGYLHGADDDRPYSVDGATYCGRCHAWIGTTPPEVDR